MRKSLSLFAALVAAALLPGCASYVTPGGPADLSGAESVDIAELMSREPAAGFPALVAIARVQSHDYRSATALTVGSGNLAVVANRDLLADTDIEAMRHWQGVRAVTPLSRILLPARLDGIDDLRVASAGLKADVLVLFTIDTSFRVDGRTIGPLSVVSLGLMRDRETVVNTTASALIVDVRTGFVYGLSEAVASERQVSNAWNSSSAADQGRLKTERRAFDDLLDEIEVTWRSIVAGRESAVHTAELASRR